MRLLGSVRFGNCNRPTARHFVASILCHQSLSVRPRAPASRLFKRRKRWNVHPCCAITNFAGQSARYGLYAGGNFAIDNVSKKFSTRPPRILSHPHHPFSLARSLATVQTPEVARIKFQSVYAYKKFNFGSRNGMERDGGVKNFFHLRYRHSRVVGRDERRRRRKLHPSPM